MEWVCCPWCGHLFKPEIEPNPRYASREWDESCPECRKFAHVRLEWVPDYEAEKWLEREPNGGTDRD